MKRNELPHFDQKEFDMHKEYLGNMLNEIKKEPSKTSILDLGCGSEHSYDNWGTIIYYPYFCLAATKMGVSVVVGVDHWDSDIARDNFTFLNGNLVEILDFGLSGYLLENTGRNKFTIVHSRLLTGRVGSPELNRTLGNRTRMPKFTDSLIEQAREVVEDGGSLYWNGDKI